MKRLRLDKIGSVTARNALDRSVVLGSEIPPAEGTLVACRVRTAKTRYNTLEDPHGRMVPLYPGDVIAGALGRREALFGYSGHVPEVVRVGDTLQLLNLGGVIGVGAEASPSHGAPFELEALGSILEFPLLDRRVGRPASVRGAALRPRALPATPPPLVALVGTCMDAGKTTAAAALIGGLVRHGLSVAAGKLTGVSLQRDVMQMADAGAARIASFTDFGVVTTSSTNVVEAAHSLVAHLADEEPDVIVLELGDGLLGPYGVRELLADPELARAWSVLILCAQDPVGAYGARALLAERFGLAIDVLSGRVTDTPVGRAFARDELGIPPANALSSPAALAECTLAALAALAAKCPEVVRS
ncbi:MAG: hypothetical protein WD226_14505 [Planctomycetota bacterium]